MNLHVSIQTTNEGLVISLKGDLDVETTGKLRERIQLATGPDQSEVVLDIAQLDFCDSQGLSTLLWLKHYSTRFEIRVPEGHRILRLFQITGLIETFNVRTT